MMEDVDRIERRLAERRAETAAALGELRSRMAVSYIAKAATHGATPALAGVAPLVGRVMMQRPVGSAMLSAGLAYMLFGPEPELKQIVRQVSQTAKQQGKSVLNTSADLVEKAKLVVADTTAGAAQMAQDVGSKLRKRTDVADPYEAYAMESSVTYRAKSSSPGTVEMGAMAFAAALAVGFILSTVRK